MKVQIFAFPFQPGLRGFNTRELEQFCLDKEVLEIIAQFFQQDQQAYWTVYVRYRLPISIRSKTFTEGPILSEKDQLLLRRLKEWRLQKASELGWPAYMVFTDKHLTAFVSSKMTTKEGFDSIKGFGAKKIQRFGEDILTIIRAFEKEDL